jgi:hypothetical protein
MGVSELEEFSLDELSLLYWCVNAIAVTPGVIPDLMIKDGVKYIEVENLLLKLHELVKEREKKEQR